jgi:hypothetical protein
MQARCPVGMLLKEEMRCVCAYLHAESWKHTSLHGIRFKNWLGYDQKLSMFKFTELISIITSADDPLQATVHLYARAAFSPFSTLIQ